MIEISQLHIYPVKSLKGISVDSALVTEKGLQYDRRWMLVDKNNRFLTLREYPQLALLQPAIKDNGLSITSISGGADELFIPFELHDGPLEKVVIWKAICDAWPISTEIDEWFADILGMPCKLVYMPEETRRPVVTASGMKPGGKITSFSDAYPFLLMSEESIEDLNQRSGRVFSIQRFRPNFVIKGGLPYQEDDLTDFQIGALTFLGVEKCARCNIPTIDPDTGITYQEKEPTRSLSLYRRQGNQIYFGLNLVHSGSGVVRVGDKLLFR